MSTLTEAYVHAISRVTPPETDGAEQLMTLVALLAIFLIEGVSREDRGHVLEETISNLTAMVSSLEADGR